MPEPPNADPALGKKLTKMLKIIELEGTDEERECNVHYSTWRNRPGNSCNDYYERKWCTIDGQYGTGWEEKWTHTDYSFGGFSSWSCPQCGCKGNQELKKQIIFT